MLKYFYFISPKLIESNDPKNLEVNSRQLEVILVKVIHWSAPAMYSSPVCKSPVWDG